ncbi:ribitol-5-phosphate xylosyltransferase 1-like isoform X1 [Paramacrobiotus metropolitanus]|uniref:ribitol-5-phosphate xylosyltransferase 1-like isoform X1 n=1 Tax=Paramacrobiotus metropolitanus TaxID=2943436 RepID=UPI00244572C4|nr:ribitol-5-phosphate xylosyltransferase 1-like isoform X1 [Paramacrobiotus metropolitanus]
MDPLPTPTPFPPPSRTVSDAAAIPPPFILPAPEIAHDHDDPEPYPHQEPAVPADPHPDFTVDIYSDAAIGIYLWQHIFKASTTSKLGGSLLYGFHKVDGLSFRFRTGPALAATETITEPHVVLVVNGRTEGKVLRARQWLEVTARSPLVENVGLVLLGNEQCNNEWLLWYLESSKYKIRVVFIVYDSTLVDGKRVFQWPLGVATYRGFPLLELQTGDIVGQRRYLCHFMGTVYRNNSRMQLVKALEGSKFTEKCYIKTRYEWPESETEDSASDYLKTLETSESVLSPLGMNAECYRIYEALSVGALPIVEDQKSPGMCDSPYRLLKEFNVPAYFVADWDELETTLEYLASLSEEELLHQRHKIIRWYAKFLQQMRDRFVNVIKQTFIIQK